MPTHPIRRSNTLQGLNVLVIGESIAGLSTTLALLQHGATVRIRERANEHHTMRNGEILITAKCARRFEALGVSLAQTPALEEHRKYVNGIKTSRKTGIQPRTWSSIVTPLREAVLSYPDRIDRRYGITAVGATPNNRQPTVHYHDGTSETADLIIAADGANSAVVNSISSRKLRFENVAIRGRLNTKYLPRHEEVHWLRAISEYRSNELHGAFYAFPAFDNPANGEQILTWMVSLPDSEAEIATRLGRKPTESFIPPGNVPRGLLQRTFEWSEVNMPPHVASVIKNPANEYFAHIQKTLADGELPGSEVYPGIAAVGSAAWAVPPSTRVGTNFAITDAVNLASALHSAARHGQSPQDGLEAFGRVAEERRSELALKVQAARAQRDRASNQPGTALVEPTAESPQARRRVGTSSKGREESRNRPEASEPTRPHVSTRMRRAAASAPAVQPSPGPRPAVEPERRHRHEIERPSSHTPAERRDYERRQLTTTRPDVGNRNDGMPETTERQPVTTELSTQASVTTPSTSTGKASTTVSLADGNSPGAAARRRKALRDNDDKQPSSQSRRDTDSIPLLSTGRTRERDTSEASRDRESREAPELPSPGRPEPSTGRSGRSDDSGHSSVRPKARDLSRGRPTPPLSK